MDTHDRSPHSESEGMEPKQTVADRVIRYISDVADEQWSAEATWSGRATVCSYVVRTDFSRDELIRRLEACLLNEAREVGVISVQEASDGTVEALWVVQGPTRIRRYNARRKRVELFEWHSTIKETMSCRYGRNAEGKLFFLSLGGGHHLKAPVVRVQHEGMLGLAKGSVIQQAFDSDWIRERALGDAFRSRLEAIHAEVGGKEFKGIQSLRFTSDRVIDPDCDAFRQLESDSDLVVTSFSSSVRAGAPGVVGQPRVGFVVRGKSGTIQLTPGKFSVERALRSELAQQRASFSLLLAALQKVVGSSDLAPGAKIVPTQGLQTPLFAESRHGVEEVALARDAERTTRFFRQLDPGAPKRSWMPVLRAIEAASGLETFDLVSETLRTRMHQTPDEVVRLLEVCVEEQMTGVGAAAFDGVMAGLECQPGARLDHAERTALRWAIQHAPDELTADACGVLLRAYAISLTRLEADLYQGVLRVRLDQLAAELVSPGATEGRLQEVHLLLEKLRDVEQGVSAPSHALDTLRRVLRSGGELRDAVDLDEAAWSELPLWPRFEVQRTDQGTVLSNTGFGRALAVRATAGQLNASAGAMAPDDELVIEHGQGAAPATITVAFDRGGEAFEVELAVPRAVRLVSIPPSTNTGSPTGPAPEINWRRALAARARIDPEGLMLGGSPALLQVFDAVEAATYDGRHTHVLLRGESGVGKTAIAQLVHRASGRPEGRFVSLTGADCGGEGGDPNAFRGFWCGYSAKSGFNGIPDAGRTGVFQQAAGGTVFIDDFESCSKSVQALVMQAMTGTAVRMAGKGEVVPEIQLIVATNADVELLVETGRLRHDFCARFDCEIRMPPLRERRGDIPILARSILNAEAPTSGRPAVQFSSRSMLALCEYDWPLNVRELQKVVRNAAVAARREGSKKIELRHLEELPADAVERARAVAKESAKQALQEFARREARAEGCLEGGTPGMQARVAEILGVSASAVSRRWKRSRSSAPASSTAVA